MILSPTQRIYDTHGNEHKEIRHLANGHSLRTETHNAENGKQAHCGTQIHAIALHQADQQEDAGRHQNKDEHIIASLTAREVKTACNDAYYCQVDDETHHQRDEMLRVEECQPNKITQLIVNVVKEIHIEC